MMQIDKSFVRKNAAGNAMIYVLIVIILFAALTFVLSTGNDTSETGGLTQERVEIYATQVIQGSMQVKQGVEQMLYTGTAEDNLSFITPANEPAFSTPPHADKVFHPDGGGVTLPRITDDMIAQVTADPLPRWYMGMFNNVEWTATTGQDVILTAFQISQPLCAAINRRLTGDATIPTLTVPIKDVLIDEDLYGAGTNQDFTAVICASCEGVPALCVKDSATDSWAYYVVAAGR